jgi:hypothetical protein
MAPQKNEKDKEKKQVLLRLSQTLWTDLAAWAEDDFRSINGQIEYLLTEAVRKRKRAKRREEASQDEEDQAE